MGNGQNHPSGPTIIINKSYEYENNNKYIPHLYYNSNDLNDLDESTSNRKRFIKESDCKNRGCDRSKDVNHSTVILMVENQGYDVLTIPKSDENTISSSSKDVLAENPKRDKHLSSADLLSFAKQIATGMVIGLKLCNIFSSKRKKTCKFCFFRISCRQIKLYIETLQPEMCLFVAIKQSK